MNKKLLAFFSAAVLVVVFTSSCANNRAGLTAADTSETEKISGTASAEPSVETDIEGVDVSDVGLTDSGYSIRIKEKKDGTLPKTVSVVVNGGVLGQDKYTYDSTTGEIIVGSGLSFDDILITSDKSGERQVVQGSNPKDNNEKTGKATDGQIGISTPDTSAGDQNETTSSANDTTVALTTSTTSKETTAASTASSTKGSGFAFLD